MAEPSPEKEIEEPYELPDGWACTRVGNLISLQSGNLIKAREYSKDKNMPYIVAGSGGPIGRTDKYNIEPPIIILGRVGACGHTEIYQTRIWATDNTHVTKPHNLELLEYLGYFFKAIDWTKYLSGTSQPLINQKTVNSLLIPLPPLPEQHRIVAKLETLLAQVNRSKDHLAKVPPLIKRFRQSVLAAACSGRLTEDWRREHPDVEPASELLNRIREERIRRYEEECRKAEAEGRRKLKKPKNIELQVVDTEGLPELPEGWVWTTIGAVSEKIHYGYTEKASNEPIGPKFLRITDIQNNNVNWDSVPYCKIKEEEKKKYLLSEGDLVFARTGATVGKSFIIKEKIPEAVFASYLIRIILDDSLDKIYISYFFHSHFYWLQIREGEIGIGQPNVNSEKLSKILFPFPSLAEQQIIVQRLETLFHFADEVGERVAKATAHTEHLTQSILARTFRGELVPQDPRDEPASVLLERIKQERAKNEMEKKTGKRKAKTRLDYC